MSFAGRAIKIKKNGTNIAGVQSRSITVGTESIDATSDDSSQFRTLLSENGNQTLDISVDGLTEDRILRDAALGAGSKLLTDITLEWPNGGSISGDFFLSNYSENGETNGTAKFSASFMSSGAWTYTPGT